MIFTKKTTLTPRQQVMSDLREHEYAALLHEDKAAYHAALAQHHQARIAALQEKLAQPEITINLPPKEKTWNPLPQAM